MPSISKKFTYISSGDNDVLEDISGTNWSSSQLQSKRRLLDKQIWLIPEDRCLFKTLEYDSEYVAASELTECVNSDLQQWTIWENTGVYFTSNKPAERWLISLWIWDQNEEEKRFGELTLTHVLPLTAYLAGSCSTNEILLYQQQGTLWGAMIGQSGRIESIDSLSSAHQQQLFKRRYIRLIDEGAQLKSFATESGWFAESRPLEIGPKRRFLEAGKLKGVADYTEPFTYFKPFSYGAFGCLIWLLGDMAIMGYEFDHLTEKEESLTALSDQSLSTRNEYKYAVGQYDALMSARQAQKSVGSMLGRLAIAIPDSVYLSALEFSKGRLVLTGSGTNVAALPVVLEQISEVDKAFFISDVRQNSSGKESFKIQLDLVGSK